jgi:hypothetical protein
MAHAKLGYIMFVITNVIAVGLILSLFAVPSHSGSENYYTVTTSGDKRQNALVDLSPTGVRFMPAWGGFVLLVFMLTSSVAVLLQNLKYGSVHSISAAIATGYLMSSGFVLGLAVYFASLIHLIGQARAPEVFSAVVVFGSFYFGLALLTAILLFRNSTSLESGASKKAVELVKKIGGMFSADGSQGQQGKEKTPAEQYAAPSAPSEFESENENQA